MYLLAQTKTRNRTSSIFSTQRRNADALFLEYLCRQQLSKTGGLQQAFFNYRCIKRMDMAFLVCRKEGLGLHSERAQEFFKGKSVSLTKAYSETNFFNAITHSTRKKKIVFQTKMILRKTKIKRRQKDIAKVPHTTEASFSCTSQNPVVLQRLFS